MPLPAISPGFVHMFAARSGMVVVDAGVDVGHHDIGRCPSLTAQASSASMSASAIPPVCPVLFRPHSCGKSGSLGGQVGGIDPVVGRDAEHVGAFRQRSRRAGPWNGSSISRGIARTGGSERWGASGLSPPRSRLRKLPPRPGCRSRRGRRSPAPRRARSPRLCLQSAMRGSATARETGRWESERRRPAPRGSPKDHQQDDEEYRCGQAAYPSLPFPCSLLASCSRRSDAQRIGSILDGCALEGKAPRKVPQFNRSAVAGRKHATSGRAARTSPLPDLATTTTRRCGRCR